MIKLLTDEHISRDLVRGLRRRESGLDILRVQDVGLRTAPDEQILEWAANNGRILVTSDIATVPDEAYKRVRQAKKMPGVIALASTISIGSAIEEILLVSLASNTDELENRVVYIPL